MKHRSPFLKIALLLGTLATAVSGPKPAQAAASREIPRKEYLRYVPLAYPRQLEQSSATKEFELFGDAAARGYRDTKPRNGIDDARDALFLALAIRFAPAVVQNTESFPMDFREVMEIQRTSSLSVDRWDLSNSPPVLADSYTIDLYPQDPKPCSGDPQEDDCKLLALLREFSPDRPTDPHLKATRSPEVSPFTVLSINTQGFSPETWKSAYQNPTSGDVRESYRGSPKTYVHPFIWKTSLPSVTDPSLMTYELVLQYWFFYPYNDAGNKHEGDWEHINVLVSPLSAVNRPLRAKDIRAILARSPEDLGGEDPLVMKRIDHYMHSKVMALDFARINAYLPRKEWDKALDQLEIDVVGEKDLLREIRKRAWEDDDETRINTHPIIYLGEGKGLELLLYSPGARNKDSHASYPFPGLYKDLGPADAAEEATRGSGRVMRYAQADRIEILPDWERISSQLFTDFEIRRNWAWMVLPIRWGYPATESPFAGIVSHAETGNISPVGPTFSSGWNRPGTALTFESYHPHRYSGLVPLSPVDNLQNNLGWLNAPALILTTLPPLDVVFTLGLLPFRAALGGNRPIFYPAERVPFRFVSAGAGYSNQFLDADEWVPLFGNSQQLTEIRAAVTALDPAGGDSEAIFADDASSAVYDLNFHLGDRFVTENSLRHSKSSLGIDVALATRPDPAPVRGTLEMWEYAGSVRYNLASRGFQPYLKLGFSWVWYRLLDVTVDGAPIATPDSDYIREPSLTRFENLFPNAWHAGIGLEIVPLMSIKPLPAGIDFSFRVEGTYSSHSLGISFADQAALGLDQPAPTVTRFGFNFLILLGF